MINKKNKKEVETLLVISNVDIEKCEGERAFSSKLIKDISSLYSVEVCPFFSSFLFIIFIVWINYKFIITK